MFKKKLTSLLFPVLGFSALLLFWWLVTKTIWATEKPQTLWLAHPRDVLSNLYNLPPEGWRSIGFSTLRVLTGLGLVFVFAIPAGVLLGHAVRCFQLLEGPLDFWRSIPPIAVLPIAFWFLPDTGEPWMGGLLMTGDRARIACIFFGCFPIVVFQLADTIRSIPIDRLDFATQIGASGWFKIRWLLFYELLPTAFRSLRTVASLSIVIVVACEMAWGAGMGIGDRISGSRYSENGLPVSYAYAMVAGILGYSINVFLRYVESRTIWWK
jgi:NitT/TauT family transport system permease protein